MRRRRPLQLVLAARLCGHTSEEICAPAEAILETLAAMQAEESPPVHWNFAAASVLENPSRRLHNLIVEIKTRQADRGDGILPAGFAGADHPRLLDEELKRELSWCFRNPWFSGLGTVFGLQPAALLPFRADPLREAAAGAYSAAGYRLLALPVAPGLPPGATGRLWSLGPGRASLLPATVVRSPAQVAELLRLAASRGAQVETMLVLLDPRGPGSAQSTPQLLRLLLAGLKRCRPLRFPRLEELCAQTPAEGRPPLSGFALAADPAAGEPEHTARFRALRTSRRRSAAELRSVLEIFRCLPAPGSGRGGSAAARAVSRLREGAPAARRGRAEIVMSASMTGLVTLTGSRYDATFVEGKLSGFAEGGRQVLGGRAARSFLLLGPQTVALQTESAFSFEREDQRGVHTELTAALAPSGSRLRLHMDSYFRDGEDPLTIEMSLELSDPLDASRFTALVPLELALPAGGGPVSLRCELPGGGLYGEDLAAAEGLLYGRRVQVSAGGAALAVEPLASGGSGIVSVQYRARRSRKPVLLLNLGGTYSRAPGSTPALLAGPVTFRVGLARG